MKILVTGCAGFIGQHLTDSLRASNHKVVGVDKHHGDLADPATARKIVGHTRPDVVVHLAAKVGRLFGEEDPAETIRANAAMTTFVARACTDHDARLVYASTSEVYGDQGDAECREDGPLALPHNLYGLSKRWGEEAARLYAPDGLTIWRISMPYGPGLPAGRGRAAIVNFLDQARRRQPIPVHEGAERSWCWIGDTVEAMRLTIEKTRGGVFNIGRDDDPRPMTEVAELACELTGAPTSLIKEVQPPERQTVVKRLSTEKIHKLGWRPTVSLRDGMQRTLEVLEERVAA